MTSLAILCQASNDHDQTPIITLLINTRRACPLLLEALEDEDTGVVVAALAAWRELLTALSAAPLAQWLQKVGVALSWITG